MKRRTFLAGAGASLMRLPCSAAKAHPAQTVFRIGTTSTPESQIGAGVAAFARHAGEMTGGRVRIECYPNSQLGGEKQMAEDLVAGGLDLAFVSTSVLSPYVPACGLFDIPFIFKTAAQARRFLDSEAGLRTLGTFGRAGAVPLAWAENGLRHVTTLDKPVRSPADLKGLKIRVPESDIMIQAFKAFGADARELPRPELYGALASGAFDGEENTIGVVIAGRLFDCQHVLSLTGHIYGPAVFLASEAAMAKLSPADRDLVRAAAVLGGKASREAADTLAVAGLAALRKQGMTIVEDVDHAAFASAMTGLEGDLVRRFGRTQIDAVRNFMG